MIIDELINKLLQFENRIAYINKNEAISYRKLFENARDLAIALKKQGTGPVIIHGHKELFVPCMMLACLMAHRTYIPVDYYTPIDRIKTIVELSGASLLVNEKDFVIDGVMCLNTAELLTGNFQNKETIINDIAYIIFTSGSTGKPKGVPISYQNLSSFINWITSKTELSEYKENIVLNTASYSFDLSVCDFYYSLFEGHTIKAYDSSHIDLAYLYGLLNDVNIAVMTPSFMEMLLLNKDFNKDNYPELKCVFFCGEKLDKGLCQRILDRFPTLKIINAYGPTEATCAISSIVIDQKIVDKENLLPVGDINYTAAEVKIVDGEIILSGDSVFKGYLGSNETISEYHTGDYGEIIANQLYVKGRKDFQIKYRGYRIELPEIENALLSIDGIRNGVVIAQKDANNRIRKLVAYVVSTINKKDIRSILKKTLPTYMIPDVIVNVEELPLNNNGKIDRKKLEQDG